MSGAPFRAVILAAGRGSRLGETTDEFPKALLPIGPRSRSDDTQTTFLRRQCEVLRSFGVEEIVVVVGYHRDLITHAAADWPFSVDFVENPTPEIMDSGSLHSFQFAAHSEHDVLDGQHQTLLMDADIVYETAVLGALLEAPEATSILVHGRVADDDEEVRVFGRPEKPRFLGKGLRGPLVDGAGCLGEAVGIIKIAPADHALARETTDWLMKFGPAKRKTEHEELSQRMMHYGRMSAVVVSQDRLFMEVDSKQELDRLRDALYPRVLDKEAT